MTCLKRKQRNANLAPKTLNSRNNLDIVTSGPEIPILLRRFLMIMLGGLALLAWNAPAVDIISSVRTDDPLRFGKNIETNQRMMNQDQNPWPPGWRQLPSPVEEGLHRVFFVNDSLGWAVTYGTGTIIHTTDAGQSWVVQAELGSEYFDKKIFLKALSVSGDMAMAANGAIGCSYLRRIRGETYLSSEPPPQASGTIGISQLYQKPNEIKKRRSM